ncbi:MAG: hypothetical protein ABIS27_02745 [Longimicrobiales bacterium]
MLLLVPVLAIIGVAAVLARAFRALFSLLRGGVDMFVANDLHDVRAQRGDLTGMEEATALRRSGRERRAVAAARISFWIGLLIAPGFTPWPAHLCASYVIFWLLPDRPSAPRIRGSFRIGTP